MDNNKLIKFAVVMVIVFVAMQAYSFFFDVIMFMFGFEINEHYAFVKMLTTFGFLIGFSSSLSNNKKFIRFIVGKLPEDQENKDDKKDKKDKD